MPKKRKHKVKSSGNSPEFNYYLSDLEKHRDKSKEYKEYAAKRFDVLIITISTVGIGFVSNQITDLDQDKTLPYISLGLFGACLLLNLFGQLFSKKVNSLALKRAENLLWEERHGTIPNDQSQEEYNNEQGELNYKIKRGDLFIRLVDNTSFSFLLTGIALFLIFIFWA